MKLPKAVRIGPHKYPLICVDQVDGRDEDWGMIDLSAMHIQLSNDLLKPELASKCAEIILHESMHGLLHEMGIDFPSETAEEQCVKQLAKGMASYMRENPTLIRSLLKALK